MHVCITYMHLTYYIILHTCIMGTWNNDSHKDDNYIINTYYISVLQLCQRYTATQLLASHLKLSLEASSAGSGLVFGRCVRVIAIHYVAVYRRTHGTPKNYNSFLQAWIGPQIKCQLNVICRPLLVFELSTFNFYFNNINWKI